MKLNQQRFKRLCKRCNLLFTPTGKFNRICDDCIKLANEKRYNKDES